MSVQKKLTGSQRLAVACDMSQLARALALARLRRLHPDWSDLELRRQLLRYAFLPDPLPEDLDRKYIENGVRQLKLEEQWDAARRAASGPGKEGQEPNGSIGP